MPEQTSGQKKMPVYAKWFGFGIEFGGVIAVFCYLGYKADGKFNSSPYFLLTGFFISCIGMLYMVIKQTMSRRK